MLKLPPDVLVVICEELGNRRDFGTLFNCALSSKSLVYPALGWIYRIHNLCPIVSNEAFDPEFTSARKPTYNALLEEQRDTLSKWVLMWKSIIRSSLGTTAYPYCLYIRALDLRNLADLLHDGMFYTTSAYNSFFRGEMTQFSAHKDTPMKQKTRNNKKGACVRFNVPGVLDRVGESITNFVFESAKENKYTAALEDISGHISATALPIWTSRLSKLKSMTLWDGSALNEKLAVSMAQTCFYFDDLTFKACLKNQDVDGRLASFFNGLRADTLRSFNALNANSVGPETLLALTHHAKSLKSLKFGGLKSEAIKSISNLQGCDTLECLEIVDADGLINLEATENDVFIEMIEWLGRCDSLRDLQLTSLVSSPEILTQICPKDNIKLRSLVVHDYNLIGNSEFHRALAFQTSLENLDLKADADGAFRDDIDALVDTLCTLSNLRCLKLISTSDYFTSSEIIRLASWLHNLEDFWFGGYEITDRIWSKMSDLHNLRALNIVGISTFSKTGIENYITTLGEGNRGFDLQVMAQSSSHTISEEGREDLQEHIRAKVGGRFGYTPHREDSESEDFSD
ncbi:hypothetical protein BJ875DRAFT_215154 [Amylocarpus encephaloides]|uniref:Uncharacterized protein n=1 Tax=Amylocarpus encephaloides TaxID=45428 RepID=A0A9P7YP81_9HELO|nr:hypothetical protein BJ875DRAFT_215154 [Amylocarpus encephaloides]